MATTIAFYIIALYSAILILRRYEHLAPSWWRRYARRTRVAHAAGKADPVPCRYSWDPMAEWERVTTRYTLSWIRSSLVRCGVPQRDVEDLCQEVLLEAHRHLSTCKHRKSPAAMRRLLGSLLQRKAIEYSKTQPAVPVDPGELGIARAELTPSPEAHAIAAELQGRLLGALKPKLRTVMKAHFGGSSTAEMASRLGVPAGTVSSRLRLARTQMEQALCRDQLRERRA